MAAKIIDGKAVAARVKEGLKTKVTELTAKGSQPGLAVVIVGDNPSSRKYVNMKKKACADLGIHSEEYALPGNCAQAELLRLIGDLNNNPKIHGILVQLPLPKHLDEQAVIERISPAKDVDGFHPINVGKLLIGIPGFLSCTPAGVMELIKETGVPIKGKECVVVGRSNIVGKPQAVLLLREHGTVTICHSRTTNLAEICRRADILVVAVGKAEFITGDMIKPGAVVIDVGTNVNAAGKQVGDVHFQSAAEVAGWITPVPGGVGPMTIAMLMKNTVESAAGFNHV
ncbi:MAG: bifunctional methylenetetrahydrofolate dehydrogenase/methenyltetrahydrofolate cyclohydrolase FolD [Bacillota bacterium]